MFLHKFKPAIRLLLKNFLIANDCLYKVKLAKITLSSLLLLLLSSCGGGGGGNAPAASKPVAPAGYTYTENTDGSLTIIKTDANGTTTTTYPPGVDVPDDVLKAIEDTDTSDAGGEEDYNTFFNNINNGTPLPDSSTLTNAQQALAAVAKHNAPTPARVIGGA